MKKGLIIGIVVILILAIGIGSYFIFFDRGISLDYSGADTYCSQACSNVDIEKFCKKNLMIDGGDEGNNPTIMDTNCMGMVMNSITEECQAITSYDCDQFNKK